MTSWAHPVGLSPHLPGNIFMVEGISLSIFGRQLFALLVKSQRGSGTKWAGPRGTGVSKKWAEKIPWVVLRHAVVQGTDGQMVKSPPEGGGGHLISHQRFQR